jgi:hypothetical protein
MAVTSFVRKTEGRSWSLLESGIWEVTELWQAKFDDQIDDPLDFMGSALLPAIGEEHPDQALLFLKRVPSGKPPIDGALKAIDFTLVWSTNGIAAADRHDPERYVDGIRATKSWSHRVVQEPVEKAYVSDDGGETWSDDKLPVENTVDDLFIPGITRNRYLAVCRYSRNELIVPVDTLELPGSVNNDTVTIDGKTVLPGQAMILAAPISSPKRFETYEFRAVDYEIIIRPEGFDEELLNAGWNCFDLENGERRRCQEPNGLDDDGEERPWRFTEQPVSLDENGVDRYQYPAETRDEDFVPHYRRFRHLRFISFAALGFT